MSKENIFLTVLLEGQGVHVCKVHPLTGMGQTLHSDVALATWTVSWEALASGNSRQQRCVRTGNSQGQPAKQFLQLSHVNTLCCVFICKGTLDAGF